MSPAKSNKIQVVWEFIQWTLLSFLCTIARQSKCRTNKNQSLSIDMHWMFSQCSDRDASPNSGLKITRRPSCVCWSGGTAAKDGRSLYLYKTWQVFFLPLLYHRRQCGSTERKIQREREGGRKKRREMLAHVLAANGLWWLCVCVGGWAHVYLHCRTMGTWSRTDEMLQG